ncbi:nitronate monooxygenase [Smaragdicoccus niigatensis]|uniref:nitronate monooxygenase n=1 Tax=Smaragdicoccus niigatensis TaxID=359359 RepID=UPI0003608510|nr:nitronate monooxygenase [Smaragdicoccus niigatensis]
MESLLGLKHPVVCAPMGGVAGGQLATAVSQAGGLGMIGMGSAGSSSALRRELDLVRAATEIGIGLVDWVVRRSPDLLETALAARPKLLAVSFGDSFNWIEQAHAAGIPVAVQVHDAASAKQAHNSGADILVARGLEGGGHGRPVHQRDSVLRQTLSATDRPVLAAGAIATAADVERALDAGAAGVWVGTAFSTCAEALSTAGHRRALFAATGADTVLTSTFDWAAGFAWPSDIPERVIANDFVAQCNTGSGDRSEAAAALRRAIAADDESRICVNAGTGVGHLTEVKSAAQVLVELCGF